MSALVSITVPCYRQLDRARRCVEAIQAQSFADFDLTLAPGAVGAITARPDADVGDLGILFFQHIVAKDENEKIRVKLHSGLMRLTMRGWLSVLAAGGPKVISWMAHKGLKGPSAVASALSRLKKG